MFLNARYVKYGLLLAILALAAYLRLTNLADNPGWYTDEAAHVNIAHNLLHGRVQYLAVNQSMLLFARPPLFGNVLAVLFAVFGEGMTTLRTFTASLGVLSVGLLYFFVRRMTSDRLLPLLSALMLAVYPQAILYSRFGFSYNLLAPLILLAFWGLWCYLETGRRRWLALACLALGIGTLFDLTAAAFVPVLVLIVLVHDWRDLVWSLPLVTLPFGLYAVVMLLSVPDAFRFDLSYTLTRVSGLSLADQFTNVIHNYTTLMTQDSWIFAGVVGLFLLRPLRLRGLSLLLFYIPIIVMGRTAALYSLSFYYMIPLLPVVALGIAALLRFGALVVIQTSQAGIDVLLGRINGLDSRLARRIAAGGTLIITAWIIASPLLTILSATVSNVQTHFPTSIDAFLINANDARQTAFYVNQHTNPDDLVIASPAVGWLFTANTADFQMSVAAGGKDAPHLPGNIPPDRFAFDPDYQRARFVVVDDLWRNWGVVHIPDVLTMLQDVETWPLVFESGAIQVYRNPSHSS